MHPTESKTRIPLPFEAIVDLCKHHDVERLDIFGSILREDFGPGSDVDFLVAFQNDDYGPWMSKLQRLQDDLTALLGREVDVVDRRGIERSDNWIRRNQILSTAEKVYGS